MARWVANGSGITGASTGAGTVATERVEIVTRGERRRTYLPEEKAALLTETAEPGARVLLVVQRHGISPSLLHRWRREAEGRPPKPQAKSGSRLPALVPLVMDPTAPMTSRLSSARLSSARPGECGGTSVEVVLRNGRILRIRAGADVATVARLAVALEA